MEQEESLLLCEKCEKVYEISGQETPCENCPEGLHKKEEIVIKQLNKDFLDVYIHCRSQVIPTMDGAIDLNFLAVKLIMELLEIPEENYLLCLNVVRRVWNYFYNKQREELERKRKK